MSSNNSSSHNQFSGGIESAGESVPEVQALSGPGDTPCLPKLRLVHGESTCLDTETIFREMIVQELRAGRLNRGQRRRIVRYAAQLGLSAIEAGEFIAECRRQALPAGEREKGRDDSLIQDSGSKRRPRRTVIGLVALALALELLLLGSLL